MLLRGFVTPLLPGKVTVSAEPERMLTVLEVARLLRVSTATVYKLCERGELAHVRVLNALRIPQLALHSLKAGGRRPGPQPT
ncbi:MAG: helix-turn-helix domain-containing protein [Anaeromyxobacter sp.]|nr:helix-turn-helix domain-containing protein [Anaeromyxobacter sp.]MBL0277540.1 helix-turn-helix domain-containing protein [Anaeromyxobacter sp.]